MPRLLLTDMVLRNLKTPETGQIAYFDTQLTGFACRVGAGGVKTFSLLYGNPRKRATIGRYPIITLANARERARDILAADQLGIKPEAPTLTFEDTLTLFFTAHVDQNNRARTAVETKRLLNRHFLPEWRTTPLGEITTPNVSKVLDGLLSTPSTARHAFVALRTFFRFAVKRGLVPHSPCERLGAPTRAETRDRVLSPEEIARVYQAASQYGYPFGTIVQLLILTGQRRGEISGARWEWIQTGDRTITIPKEIAKNGRASTFPYGDMTAAILEAIPRKEGYLFAARGTQGEHSFNGWSKSKAILAKTLDPAIPDWSLHDLRRSWATIAAEFAPPHVVERILNHASGTISGVAAIYNRRKYMEEMRAAVEKWDAHLSRLTGT
jgi:integrase